MEAKYQKAKAEGRLVPLEDVTPTRAWKYWKLIPNGFGYDRYFGEGVPFEHYMLLPFRKFARRRDMKLMELAEQQIIKDELEEEGWDSSIENFTGMRSVQDHYHEHVLRRKK
jgi:hypothetical protein